jgi:CheY-like chemotaxis protein
LKKRICFIDDDGQFEIPLFTNVFGETFDLVTATTLADCLTQIKNREEWTPYLFVLDMYFPLAEPDHTTIDTLKSQPIQLPDDHAEIRQSYINYRIATDRLRAVLDAWKQGADGGIALAKQVQQEYPDVPIVFYSRKTTAEDVLRCMQLDGVFDVILKPTGTSDEDTEEVTIASKERLSSQFERIIEQASSRSSSNIKDAVQIVVKEIGFFSHLAE